jgi:hypothetical protein
MGGRQRAGGRACRDGRRCRSRRYQIHCPPAAYPSRRQTASRYPATISRGEGIRQKSAPMWEDSAPEGMKQCGAGGEGMGRNLQIMFTKRVLGLRYSVRVKIVPNCSVRGHPLKHRNAGIAYPAEFITKTRNNSYLPFHHHTEAMGGASPPPLRPIT